MWTKGKVFRFVVWTFAMLFLVCYSSHSCLALEIEELSYDKSLFSITNLGNYAYSIKTLNGIFYRSHDNHIVLVSGTETTEGAISQIFVYDVSCDQIINTYDVETACSFTAFVLANDESVYIGSISRDAKDGCLLVRYDINQNTFDECAHFDGKGIYALSVDKKDVVVATSKPVAVYKYNTINSKTDIISANVTNEPYAFSVITNREYCYVATGTKAYIYQIDMSTGKVQNILPDDLVTMNSSVGGFCRLDDEVYFYLSPTYQIGKLNVNTGNVEITNMLLDEKIFDSNVTIPKEAYNLAGNILFKNYATDDMELFTLHNKVSFCETVDGNTDIYGLDISGIVSIVNNGEIVFERDLCSLLQKSYSIPMNIQVNNNIIYIPGRRFIIVDLNNNNEKCYLVQDEPQASKLFDSVIYTANYTSCTLYAYPLDIFNGNLAIQMNDEKYLIADIENQCRPKQIDIDNRGKYLILGSGPLYGEWGGYCSVYNLSENVLEYSIEILANHLIQSVEGSSAFDNSVWLGTSPYGENTYPQFIESESSHLLLWNIVDKEIKLDLIPEEGMRKIPSICEFGNAVYCITQSGHMYAYDIYSGKEKMRVTDVEIDKVLVYNDHLYGIGPHSLYEIDIQENAYSVVIDGFEFLCDIKVDEITNSLYLVDSTEILKVRAIE